jgi:hypothetical protein
MSFVLVSHLIWNRSFDLICLVGSNALFVFWINLTLFSSVQNHISHYIKIRNSIICHIQSDSSFWELKVLSKTAIGFDLDAPRGPSHWALTLIPLKVRALMP